MNKDKIIILLGENVLFREKIKILQLIYLTMSMILLGILVIGAVKDLPKGLHRESDSVSFSLSDGWVDENNNPVNLKELTGVPNANTGEWVSIYNILPERIPAGSSFCMQTGYIYYEVYLNGELLYEPDVPESRLYNKSFGHAWCLAPVSDMVSGGEIEIRFTCSYPDEKAYIQKVYVGSGITYFLEQIKQSGMSFLASVLLLFLGIIYIVMSIPIMMQNKSSYEMIYLGLLSIAVSAWSLSETRLIQLLFDNSRTMNIFSDAMLMLISIPSVFYADMAIKNRLTRTSKIIASISICQILISILLHLFNIVELRSMLFSTHIVMIIGAAYILYRVVKAVLKKELESAVIYQVFRIIGLLAFVLATIIDLYRYYNNIGQDRAVFVRIGLLIFVACYGIASLEKNLRAIQKSAESELITKLAYQDGLTEVGNRTAYQEYIENIQERLDNMEQISVGMVMFDINDLKITNDKRGHLVGDQLIKQCARLIEESFNGIEDRVFRIGGDEFVVLEVTQNTEISLQQKIESFKNKVDEFNKENEMTQMYTFSLFVACGMACFREEGDEESLADMAVRADYRMYGNKQKMKNK